MLVEAERSLWQCRATSIGQAGSVLRSPLGSITISTALVTSLPAFAKDLPSVEGRPSHYTVQFGATIGKLEPIAGEVLCARDRDCEILLAFVPRITIRVRADPDNVRYGLVKIDCADPQCALDLQEREVSYGSKVNDLPIWTGQGQQGVRHSLVWHPWTLLGRFKFVIAP